MHRCNDDNLGWWRQIPYNSTFIWDLGKNYESNIHNLSLWRTLDDAQLLEASQEVSLQAIVMKITMPAWSQHALLAWHEMAECWTMLDHGSAIWSTLMHPLSSPTAKCRAT
jgi:hypothetical protein